MSIPIRSASRLGHDHELKRGVRDDARQVVPDRRLNERGSPRTCPSGGVLQPVDVTDGDRIFEVLALGDVLEVDLLRDQRIALQRRQRIPDRRDTDEDQEARREKNGNRVEDRRRMKVNMGSSLRSLRKTGVPPRSGRDSFGLTLASVRIRLASDGPVLDVPERATRVGLSARPWSFVLKTRNVGFW